MNRLFFIVLLLSGISQADETPPHELVIQHVPLNIEIIKQCGNNTQRQSSQIVSSQGSSRVYSSSSAFSVSSVSVVANDKGAKDAKTVNECTLTIRTAKPCLDKVCRQVIDFNSVANLEKPVKSTK